MSDEDPYVDPYSMNFNAPLKKEKNIPKPKGVKTNIFTPNTKPPTVEKQVNESNVKKDVGLPEFVDLTRNVYATNQNEIDDRDELPLLEGKDN